MKSARFITLEGVDGAGKSTHLQFIADAVAAASGRHAIVTREPGGTDLAEHLRRTILEEPMDAMAETLLIFAARAHHVRKVIVPALDAGSWVVCDRFLDATYAYQGAGKGVPLELIERLARRGQALARHFVGAVEDEGAVRPQARMCRLREPLDEIGGNALARALVGVRGVVKAVADHPAAAF